MSLISYDFQCPKCGKIKKDVLTSSMSDAVECPHCKWAFMTVMPVATKSYEIRGDNSASTKPSKERSTG